MADWVHACDRGDIDEEDLVRWDHEGRTFAIYNAVDGFYCTQGDCTHEDEHLEAGLLTGHVIECPLHQGRFDIRSGRVLSPPPCIDLDTYPVKTEDGRIYVKVQSPGGERSRGDRAYHSCRKQGESNAQTTSENDGARPGRGGDRARRRDGPGQRGGELHLRPPDEHRSRVPRHLGTVHGGVGRR